MHNAIIFICLLLCVCGCRPKDNNVQVDQRSAIKNIILLIGDGMGTSQVSQAMLYADQHPEYRNGQVFRELFTSAATALVTTGSADSPVTDSAAAATAIACGFKTNNDLVGMDPSGKPCESILRIAKKQGKATGLVSNMRLAHATPAAFAASAVHRGMENEMAAQIIDEGLVNVLLSGGGRNMIPQGTDYSDIAQCTQLPALLDGSSKRTDDRNLIAEAQSAGFTFACTKEQLLGLGESDGRVLGIFSRSTFPAYPERKDLPGLPTLEDMTRFAINNLSQEEDGFFLMVEAGMIDYAGHSNDALTQLQETLDFTHSIRAALDYAKGRSDTLVIVTADHETGGYGLSYKKHRKGPPPLSIGAHQYTPRYHNPTHHVFDDVFQQSASFYHIAETGPYTPEDLQDRLLHATQHQISTREAEWILQPRTEDYHSHDHPGDLDPFCGGGYERIANRIGHVLAKRSMSTWATGHHTHHPVNVFVSGPSHVTREIRGLLDNTDLFYFMKRVTQDLKDAP